MPRYNTVVDFLQARGITPRLVSTHKGEHHSPCPLCGGNDRFHTFADQNNGQGSWWCRQCGQGGDLVALIMLADGVDFRTAADWTGKQLEDRARPQRHQQAPIVPAVAQTPLQPRECRQPTELWQQQARQLVDRALADLQGNTEQLDYLASRGISSATAEHWQLGFVSANDTDRARYASRRQWGLPPRENSLRPDTLWIPRGLVIPNIIDGRIDSIRIRRSAADRSATLPNLSYHLMPGSGTAPLLSLDQARCIIVVEAQLDAILLHQHCRSFAGVLALGNSTARPDGRAHAALQHASLVLVALDADDAGDQASHRWLEWYDQAVRIQPPAGKDPGEAQAAGVDLRDWILDHLPSPWRAALPVPAAPTPPPAKVQSPPPAEEIEAVIIQTASGRQLCVVTDPVSKAHFQRTTGLPVASGGDLDHLASLTDSERERWLTDQDPLPAAPAEHGAIIRASLQMFNGTLLQHRPTQPLKKEVNP